MRVLFLLLILRVKLVKFSYIIHYLFIMKKIKLFLIFFVSFFIVLPCVNANIAITPLKHELTIEQWKNATKKIKVTNEWKNPITLYTSTEDFISWDSSWQPKFLKPEDQESPELSLANWISVDEKNITLSVWETREISFNITVPSNWEPGWHYWAIFFSPWIQKTWKVAFSQRVWVLILINVPWDIKIDWELKSTDIWIKNWKEFKSSNNFSELPIDFKVNFVNNWNIHLKPTGKIELIDENWNILKKIGKEIISAPNWTYIWEKLVDYLPINNAKGSVLPNSNRDFISQWNWFWYTILNENWTTSVLFKNISDYYKDKASEKQAYLMFWEQIHTKNVEKKIIANYTLSYKSKDIKEKNFNKKEEFFIKYSQQYVWLNYYLIIFLLIAISWATYFFIIHLPKTKTIKEEELRKKIIAEMNKK